MSDETKKTFERAEIQASLEPFIEAKFTEMGIPDDMDHTRRKIRSCVRIGAKMAIDKGCDPQTFMAIAYECYAKEAGIDKATSQEEAQQILEAKLSAKGETN